MTMRNTPALERPHWAADLAAETLARETNQVAAATAAITGDVRLRELATAGAERWFDRLTTALEAIAAAFNTRVGCPRLVVLRTAATATLRVHDFGYVAFSAVIGGQSRPGIDVTIETFGRRTVQPYDFSVSHEQLEIAGEAPEAFCRRTVERWLVDVPARELGGGLPPAA
jgi:hypothetical protein